MTKNDKKKARRKTKMQRKRFTAAYCTCGAPHVKYNTRPTKTFLKCLTWEKKKRTLEGFTVSKQ